MDDRPEERIPETLEDHHRALTLLRLALLGLVVVAAVSVAAPGARVADPAAAAACASTAAPQSVIVLPPGHPPIHGIGPQGRAATALPPGHPPIDGFGARPARPLAPLFTAPEIVDL